MFPVFPEEIENVLPFERVIVPEAHDTVSASVELKTISWLYSKREMSVEELFGMEDMGVPVMLPPVIVIDEAVTAPASVTLKSAVALLA